MEQLSVVEDTREERESHTSIVPPFITSLLMKKLCGQPTRRCSAPCRRAGVTTHCAATGGAVAPPTCFPLSGLFGDENFLVWISGLLWKHQGSSEFMDENHLFEIFLSGPPSFSAPLRKTIPGWLTSGQIRPDSCV